MAVLTWRNVDTPNLAGAAQVVGEAGRGMGTAFSDLAAGLGAFNQARTDRADAAAIQAASQITDSGQYAQALQEGSILRNAGIDPNMISGKAAELLAGRQKDLLGADFTKAQIANQVADNEMARKRFEAEQAQQIITNKRDDYRFGRQQAADLRADEQLADTKAAQELLFAVNQAGTDAAGARQLVNSANVSDRVKQSVLGSLGLGGGVLKLATPGTGVPGRGADAVYGNGQFGAPELPLSSQNFGYAHDFGQSLIEPTRGKVGAGVDKGTSAVGAYQFIGDTMETYAKKVFGDNWREVPFTFENQSKIAEALFDDSKGGNLQAVWAGLPDARPGAYKDMSFEEFQRTVLPLESGVTLEEARAQDEQTRVAGVQATSKLVDEMLNTSLNQRLGNIQLDKYQKDLQNDNPDLSVAAEKAIKENPALKGTDLNQVAEWLSVIQQKASATGTPMSASAATHVLGAAMRPDTGILDFDYFGTRDAASGFIFDKDLVDQTLQDINSGGALGRGVVARDSQADKQKLTAAATALSSAVKDMQTIREREAAGQPVTAAVRERAATALSKALKRNEDLNASIAAKQQPATVPTVAEKRSEAQRKLDEAAARFQTPISPGAQATRPMQVGPSYGPAATLLEERLAR